MNLNMDYEIEVCLNELNKASDLFADWLIKSFSLKGDDKIIALAYYRKAEKEEVELSRRLDELTEKKYGKNTKS